MATENTTNNKNVTVSQLKKSLTRAKAESDKAIENAAIGGGTTATDAEIDEMLNEVFGADAGTTDPGGEENAEGEV